ncbi:hypothetical protein AV274_3681 [Blastocystis sp. ATCC 50177/Nand II]|uniref:Transmembrane protein n=1 Tax=Blastocystis sp. subtype 1 (strain ATCC 50177 / NandII) TaxID=478820 RepID=A0A196SES1_BLAHN|nr:hypothetical protein AV274_3681 [Blastocystis sp. ATCC 50177/Nand II]
MCKSAFSSAVYTIFSIVATLFMLFLYTIYSTNPGMYDELTNPAKTCKGVFQTAIAYAVTALISGGFWIHYVQQAKKHPAVEKSVFEENKKRFHFATKKETEVPLLKAQF